jgi:tripartite-type tricarboxylate transporter receptor subunit TctC
LSAASRITWAQAYPSRPVSLIAGFAPGGGVDITARLIGQWLSERLGQQFVIENRPGASSSIATEAVVRAPADGYTLLLIGSFNTINATLYDKLNYNFIRDIAPVASVMRYPYVMVVNPSFPAKSVPECRFPSSSPMPRPIPVNSTWRRPAPAVATTLPASRLR